MQIQDVYETKRTLGYGATSEVIEVMKRSTQQTRALKLFSPAISNDEQAVQRLEVESSVLEQLEHPNIVKIFDKMKFTTSYALELEFVDGQDLRRWMESYQLQLLEPKLWILSQAARGLGAAHEKAILHRDLKPENILISNEGTVKITDFGVAKLTGKTTLTQAGFLIGSIGYMAPEMISGGKATIQSDIFSFGVMAYELLTRKSPFPGETVQAIIRGLLAGEVTPLSLLVKGVPADVESIIHSCLSTDPEKRPPSIWHVEAVLMTSLLNSGLLSFCRTLVSTAGRNQILAQALEKKHQVLLEDLQELEAKIASSDSRQFREEFLRTLSDLQRVFPEDPKIGESLLLLKERRSPVQFGKKNIFWIVLLLIFSSGFAFYFFTLPKAPIEKSHLAEPTLAPASLPTAAVASPPPALVKERKSTKPSVPAAEAKGSVQFIVDSDVQIWVEDKLLSAEEMKNYVLKPGKYSLRMEKAGFLPIDSSFQIRAGKTTTINTKGGH